MYAEYTQPQLTFLALVTWLIPSRTGDGQGSLKLTCKQRDITSSRPSISPAQVVIFRRPDWFFTAAVSSWRTQGLSWFPTGIGSRD